MNYLLLIVGFALLIAGADYLVRGASSIAKRLKVSDLIIGLTVVSIGTSAPELSVNIIASLDNAPGMAIGNVIGSNIFNFLVIIGFTAIISPIGLRTSLLKFEIPFAILASLALIFVASDTFLDSTPGVITRSDGMILMLFFAIFMYYIFLSAKKGEIKEEEVTENDSKLSVLLSVIYIAGGLGALVFGGDLIVSSATELAIGWGMSETVIGLTIVAMGTSLPELATSMVAAYKGNSDIAIGNVVGSNIFNIFLILGASSVITPLPFATGSSIDALVAAAATGVVLFFGYRGKGLKIDRKEGIILVVMYAAYITYLLV
jgi:cation:H+ antiporter